MARDLIKKTGAFSRITAQLLSSEV